jgi:predicted nucleic acid-binding protein
MRVFLDSSGLAKRYIREPGSDAVQAILAEANEAAVSLIAPPEIVSALNRLRRQSALGDEQYVQAKGALFSDLEDMGVLNLTVQVVQSAIGLLERFPLRSLDALHVACALEWPADLFVTADRRQLAAAAASGLRTRKV